MSKEIAQKIRAGYGDMRKSEQKAADFILEHLDTAASFSLDRLALESGVSQPTVMRMLKKIGYESYREFRNQLLLAAELAKAEEREKSGEARALYGYPLHPGERLEEEGGIPARSKRYYENNHLLIQRMKEMGIHSYVEQKYQGPIITTFFYPENCHFTFSQMYEYIKERGYAIYPGKLTEGETFRIGNIGEIYPEDIEKVCGIIKDFLEEYNHE